MKLIGQNLTFNDKKIYHEDFKPKANDISFLDGETFQDKLDNGSLKGEPGETGPQGPQGEPGPAGQDGKDGQDGTSVSISVNGEKYNHSDGTITLPNLLKESGGKITGSIDSSVLTASYLDGNKGKALMNSTAEAGEFVTLLKSNSINGTFTLNSYGNNLLLGYTSKDTVTAEKNELTHSITLFNEQGSAQFNSLTAKEIFGPNVIKLASGELFLNTINQRLKCDYLRLSNNFLAADNNKKIHLIDVDGNPADVYVKNLNAVKGSFIVNPNKETNYNCLDVYRKCETNTVNGYTHSTARFGCVNTWGGAASIEYRENDSTKNQIEVHDNFVKMNGKPLFIQSGTPSISTGTASVAMPTGSVWIQI